MFCSRTFMSLVIFMLWRELEALVDVSSIQRRSSKNHQTHHSVFLKWQMERERVSQRARSHQAPVQTVTTCSRTHRSDSQGIHQHTMSQLSCQRLEPSWEVILGYKLLLLLYKDLSVFIICNLNSIYWSNFHIICQTILLVITFSDSLLSFTSSITLSNTQVRQDLTYHQE